VVAAQKLAAATATRPHPNAFSRSFHQFRAYHALHPAASAANPRNLPANLANDPNRATPPRPPMLAPNAIGDRQFAYRGSPGYYTPRQQPRVNFRAYHTLDTITEEELDKMSIESRMEYERKQKLKLLARCNILKCSATALYASDLINMATIPPRPTSISKKSCRPHLRSLTKSIFNIGAGLINCRSAVNNSVRDYFQSIAAISDLIKLPEARAHEMHDLFTRYVCFVPHVSAPCIEMHASHAPPSRINQIHHLERELDERLSPSKDFLHPIESAMRTQFPETRLIQYDCGKLQTLDTLLWKLKSGGHRVLIFTQMSRMLDILEQFLNCHGHTYLRLDGSTRIEQRQALMERFNNDRRIFCFILSTRSGGIGVNLTGADTVIFYDSDWNPTMDAQAQDRCHRIGQTRDVHIYRLVSERTIEVNILKKAQQKRLLGDLAIEEGNFTTAFLKEKTVKELFDIDENTSLLDEPPPTEIKETTEAVQSDPSDNPVPTQKEMLLEQVLGAVEDDIDAKAARTARAEAAADMAEFDESIPIEADAREIEEKTEAEEQYERTLLQMTPVERYALRYWESTQEPVITEQQKLQDEELEAEKSKWEISRMNAIKQDEKRRSESVKEERESVITCHRDDAYTQVNNNQKRNTRVRDRKNITHNDTKVRDLGPVVNGRSKGGRSNASPRKNVSSPKSSAKPPLTNGVPPSNQNLARKSKRGISSPQEKNNSTKANETHYSLRHTPESSPKRSRKATFAQDSPASVSPVRDLRTRQRSNSGSSSPTKRTRGTAHQSPSQTPTNSKERVLRRSSRGTLS